MLSILFYSPNKSRSCMNRSWWCTQRHLFFEIANPVQKHGESECTSSLHVQPPLSYAPHVVLRSFGPGGLMIGVFSLCGGRGKANFKKKGWNWPFWERVLNAKKNSTGKKSPENCGWNARQIKNRVNFKWGSDGKVWDVPQIPTASGYLQPHFKPGAQWSIQALWGFIPQKITKTPHFEGIPNFQNQSPKWLSASMQVCAASLRLYPLLWVKKNWF